LAKELPRAGGLLIKCITVTFLKIFAESGASEFLAKSFQFFKKIRFAERSSIVLGKAGVLGVPKFPGLPRAWP